MAHRRIASVLGSGLIVGALIVFGPQATPILNAKSVVYFDVLARNSVVLLVTPVQLDIARTNQELSILSIWHSFRVEETVYRGPTRNEWNTAEACAAQQLPNLVVTRGQAALKFEHGNTQGPWDVFRPVLGRRYLAAVMDCGRRSMVVNAFVPLDSEGRLVPIDAREWERTTVGKFPSLDSVRRYLAQFATSELPAVPDPR